MSTIGRFPTPTLEVLPGIVPAGGLKLMVGNVWVNKGCCPGSKLITPDPLDVKNRPVIAVDEMVWLGTTQLTVEVLDWIVEPAMLPLARAESVPVTVPV